jgi:ketosteroid isomerase-like protein
MLTGYVPPLDFGPVERPYDSPMKQTIRRSSGPLEDRIAIRELVESYNDAVMRFDPVDWGANWAEDGVWSLPGRGEVKGRDKIVPFWTAVMGAIEVDGFFASAGTITVTGDTAHATWYQQEFLRDKPTDAATTVIRRFVIGEYTDDYVKQSGRWFFAKRVYTVRTSEVRQ